MNSSFNILTPGFNTSQCHLIVLLNGQGVSYVVLNANKVCVALANYPFNIGSTNEQIADFLKEIMAEQFTSKQPFKKVSLIYAFPESVLIPHQFLNLSTKTAMLELVYGDITSTVIKKDFVKKNNLHNLYCIPDVINTSIAQLFPRVNHYHLYSLLQNIVKTTVNYLYCIINTTHVIIQLVKEGKLQIIQSFEYKQPEDISYYLLSICKNFDVPPLKTPVYLNGIIDAGTPEMIELQRYFPIEYGSLPKSLILNDEIQKYPLHYYNYLFELSECV